MANPFWTALSKDSLTGVLFLLAPCWVLWIAVGLVLHAGVQCKGKLPSVIRDVMEYGKLKEENSINGFSSSFNIPKRYFTHFYIWGAFWILTLNLVYICRCVLFSLDFKLILVLDGMIEFVTGGFLQRNCASKLTQHHVEVAIVLSMLSVHVLRRLYECLFVSVLSPIARMHLVHYILGMLFYPGVAFTTLLHLDAAHDDSSLSVAAPSFHLHHYIAMAIFLWASLHQHVCHQILADLRNARKKEGGQEDHSYHQPNGDWFELVSCPHFLAEVIIYAAMLFVFVWSDVWSVWWLVMFYIVSTLGLSARQAHAWYKRKFRNYPRHRCAMIPWLC